MDRFDIKIVMMSPKIKIDELTEREKNIASKYKRSSCELKKQILQSIEFRNDLKTKRIKQKLSQNAKEIIDRHISNSDSSLRNIRKIINVAKTIACLELSEEITEAHLLESISYTRPVFN